MTINYQIKTSDRVFIAGQTGSGKTYWSRSKLWNVKRLIVIDAKDQLKDWKTVQPDDKNLKKFMNGGDLRLRLVPSIGTVKEIGIEIDEYLKKAYQARNCVVYIDEMYSLASNNFTSTWLTALWTRGRSLGIGVWAVAQRPYNIPLYAMSEAQYYVCFRLKMHHDKQRMAELMGREILQYDVRDYEYFFYKDGTDKPVLVKSNKE